MGFTIMMRAKPRGWSDCNPIHPDVGVLSTVLWHHYAMVLKVF